ncbi:MAG TPA: MBL fold metallo-hydrolase [Povalibacter sp.]
MAALVAGQLDEIAPGVRRLVANNASVLTGPGTNTYLVGRERCVVIDPGPIDALHIDRVLAETAGNIAAVLVTHTHRDHSPAAMMLAEATGAEVLGCAPVADSRHDSTFHPSRELADGDEVDVEGFRLRVLHTPGHASNHLCYAIDDLGLLFTGDHLIQGTTVVIIPPDGSMADYLLSLRRLQAEPVRRIAPGHGTTIEDAHGEIARIIEHRLRREDKVLQRLTVTGAATLDALVVSVYDDVDPRLHPIAQASLLAHLIKLEADGRVCREAEVWKTTTDDC